MPLEPGRYWVAVQANMDFTVGGEWGWETRISSNGHKAAWRNRRDGFSTGCKHYGNMIDCLGDLGQGPDFMFSILGDRQPQ